MNSTMEGLYNAVPLVVIPQMIEQDMTAHRVEELSLGIRLAPDNVSVDALRSAVAQVQENEAIHERVRAMQQEIRNCGGYKGATDKLIEYAQQQ
jgi:MGT family glycosyltransferase